MNNNIIDSSSDDENYENYEIVADYDISNKYHGQEKLDDLEVNQVVPFCEALKEYILVKDTTFVNNIKASKKLGPDDETLLKEIIGKIKTEINS